MTTSKGKVIEARFHTQTLTTCMGIITQFRCHTETMTTSMGKITRAIFHAETSVTSQRMTISGDIPFLSEKKIQNHWTPKFYRDVMQKGV